ncbi:hypothetical protein N9J39_02855, partial [Flavicella sp.]
CPSREEFDSNYNKYSAGVVKQPVLGAHPSQKLECSFFSFGGFDLFLHLAKSKAPKRTILYPVDSSYL